MKQKNFFKVFILIIFVIELGVFGYLYFTSDNVECNFIFCTFEKQLNTQIINSTYYQTCYLNDIKINCSEMDK